MIYQMFFFGKPAPWECWKILTAKLGWSDFFHGGHYENSINNPRRYLYVKPCNAAKVHGNSNENISSWRLDMIRCGFSSNFLGCLAYSHHFFCWAYSPGQCYAEVNRDRNHHLKEIRSYILSNPYTSCWFCKSQFVFHKCDARCWHENSWWIGTGALVDDGSSERFLLRMIKISYHENHPRIFEWYKNQYFILISWISPWFACHFGWGQMIKIMIFWKW